MKDLPKLKARLGKIDVQLEKAGWLVKDENKVRAEVDIKQANFKSRNYKFVSNTLKRDLKRRSIDYLFLNSKMDFIALIEAKIRTKSLIMD